MTTPVTMPQLGETVIEGTITKWLKREGETIERDELLFEISTDKVDTEVPSPVAGTLVKIKVQEGETVSVGTELALIDTGDQQTSTSTSAPSPAVALASPAAPASPAVMAVAPIEAPRPATVAGGLSPLAPAARVARPGGEGERSQILSPLVRRLAQEHQIDLGRIQGTGTGGRITKNDVLSHLGSSGTATTPAAPSVAPAVAVAVPIASTTPAAERAPASATEPESGLAHATGAGEELVPLSRIRHAIAAHMTGSLQTTARAWNLVEVDMEHIVRVRTAAKDAFAEREGMNLTYMPFLAKAVCDALLAHPDVNSELRDDQLVRKHFVNLGIAVALDDGLIVPVVKGADSMNVVGLARAINDMAVRARTKKLTPDDVHGGTFTITNPGPYGSIISLPIINTPECAILAFDTIEKRPVVIDDAIAIRHMVYLSMSWDHRIIDGATAAEFLGRLKQNLETWDFGPDVGLPARS